MIPEWVNKYTGLPFEDYNCWQLMCLIYKNEFWIELPTFDTEYQDSLDKEKIKEIYERELTTRFPKIDNPQLNCFIVLRMQGQPWHCGLVIDDSLMLHTEKKINAVIERFDSKIWKNRIIGFYEYIA